MRSQGCQRRASVSVTFAAQRIANCTARSPRSAYFVSWRPKSCRANELKALAGIREADAKKIVDNRPYKSTDELVQKKVVPKATYDKIKDQIVAK
jgi:radical SAM superfamily enzyme with C-terminal helix-hairpin-helix motif